MLAPCFVVLIAGLAIWNVFDQSRFIRAEGNLKRGVMIWANILMGETCQALEALPSGVTQSHDGFVRKEGGEVLVVVQPSFWGRHGRRMYVGYVNLHSPEIQLELRLAWSTLISVMMAPVFILIFFINLFTSSLPKGQLAAVGGVFLLIFLTVFIGSLWFSFYRERKSLRAILDQAARSI
jgi:hypothetical protein